MKIKTTPDISGPLFVHVISHVVFRAVFQSTKLPFVCEKFSLNLPVVNCVHQEYLLFTRSPGAIADLRAEAVQTLGNSRRNKYQPANPTPVL